MEVPADAVSEAVIERLDGPDPGYCHAVHHYFRSRPTAVATIDDLATGIAERRDESETQIAIQLHHMTLPRLAAAGLVDYDARSNTARYRGDE